MIERALVWGVRRFIGGPGRSWVFTSLAVLGLRAVRSVVGRRELVDTTPIKKGQTIVIEPLDISHGKQMKQFAAEEKAAKRAAKAVKREEKAAARAARRAKREQRAADRAARRAARAASDDRGGFVGRVRSRAGMLEG